MPKLHTMDFGGNVLISWHKKEVKLHVLGFLKSLRQAPSNEIPSTSGIKAQEAVAATAETITNQASTLHNHIAGYSQLGTPPLATEEEEENVVSSQEKHAIHVNTLELSVKEKEAVCMFLLKISNVDQIYSQLNKFMAEKNKARQRTFIGTRRTTQAQKLDLVVEYLLSKNSQLTARKQPGQAEFCVSDLFLEI